MRYVYIFTNSLQLYLTFVHANMKISLIEITRLTQYWWNSNRHSCNLDSFLLQQWLRVTYFQEIQGAKIYHNCV